MDLTSDLEKEIRIIEYHMLDKSKFFPLTVTSTLSIRFLVYPLTLVRTHLQVQQGNTVYKGTFDAFSKIWKNSGWKGLYRGFGVNSMYVFTSMIYVNTYENVRQLSYSYINNSSIASFIGGGFASFFNLFFIVPIEIVSQHMMLVSVKNSNKKLNQTKNSSNLQHIKLSDAAAKSEFRAMKEISSTIYRTDGIKGFYKGFFVSGYYIASSALWWCCYDFYGGLLFGLTPDNTTRMGINMVSSILSGMTTSVVTNPLDVFKTRLQVTGEGYNKTLMVLLREERLAILTKGLYARMMSSCLFSVMLATGYEYVKRASLKEEFKPYVRW